MAHSLSSVPLQSTLEFAGFCLSHGIWTVAGGTALPPLLLIESDEGRAVVRIPGASFEAAVAVARGNADSLASHLTNACVVYDGWVRDQGDAVDVVVVEASLPGLARPITVVQRYVPAGDDGGGFAILGRPLFPHPLDRGAEVQAQGFLDRGIAQHPSAAQLWSSRWVPDQIKKSA